MSTISASTTSTTGFKVTSDTTGTLVFQTGASPTTAMSISSSQIISFTNPPTATGGGSVSTNTAYGTSALAANTTGDTNTAVGYQALTSNQGGASNTAYGVQAMRYNTSGGANVGVGREALVSNTSGSYNVGLGQAALYNNTTASNNTAVGYQAGYSSTANSNTFIGNQAGYGKTGANSIYIGSQAGFTSGAANYNCVVGYGAGYSLTTGSGNTFFGSSGSTNSYGSGYYVSTGNNNTILGAYTGNQGGLDIRTSSNWIVLSDGDGNPWAYGRASDAGSSSQFILNNTGGQYTELQWRNSAALKAEIWWDNVSLRLQTYTGTTNGPYVAQNGTSWTNSSDERLKNITGEIQNGLAKVCSLRAAEYTWKADVEAKPQVGLIAQDVLAVLPQAVDIPPEGATEKDGSPAMMGVQYTAVIPLLVAAIKELKAEIDTLKGQA